MPSHRERAWNSLPQQPNESPERFQVRQNIVRFRQETRITQEECAARIGISTSMYFKIENGTRGISIELLRALAKSYGRKEADFFEKDPPPPGIPEINVYQLKTVAGFSPDIKARLDAEIARANTEELARLKAAASAGGKAKRK